MCLRWLEQLENLPSSSGFAIPDLCSKQAGFGLREGQRTVVVQAPNRRGKR